jgi:hypothetical protein
LITAKSPDQQTHHGAFCHDVDGAGVLVASVLDAMELDHERREEAGVKEFGTNLYALCLSIYI